MGTNKERTYVKRSADGMTWMISGDGTYRGLINAYGGSAAITLAIIIFGTLWAAD